MEFILPVTTEEYQQAGSKFVTIPPGETEVFLDVEIGILDWETTGKSLKIPVTVIEEGADYGKTDKLVFGITRTSEGKSGIFKGKDAYRAITGREPPSKVVQDGTSHPVFDSKLLTGKLATGHWQLQTGTKGGVVGGDPVTYPKLVNILPPRGVPASAYSGSQATPLVTPPVTPKVAPAEAENVVLQAVIGSTEEDITTRVAKVPQIQALGLSIAGLFRVVDQLAEKGLLVKDESGRYQKAS